MGAAVQEDLGEVLSVPPWHPFTAVSVLCQARSEIPMLRRSHFATRFMVSVIKAKQP